MNQINSFMRSLQRSNLSRNCGAVSPWGPAPKKAGENKRGEFLHLIPPPSPRQRGTSSEITTVLPYGYLRNEIPCTPDSLKLSILQLKLYETIN